MILVLCGPPGSGKSSIAQRLICELEDAYLIFSDMFKGKVYEKLMKEVQRRLGDHKYLVLDATFYKKKWRDKLREIVEGKENIMTIFIESPLETCLIRNRDRENPIPEKAVRIIWKEFERPEKFDVYLNTESLDIEQSVRKILDELESCVLPL